MISNIFKTNFLDKVEDDGFVSIIIRHSIRPIIHDASKSNDVMLTDEGRQLAQTFGTELPDRNSYSLYHSPIGRCRETAECIEKGITEKSNVVNKCVETDIFGGFFIKNQTKVFSALNDMKQKKFIQSWFSGKLSENIILPIEEVRSEMVRYIKGCCQQKNNINIFVTHDWNVLVMLSYLFDFDKQNVNWPNYMDGLVVSFNNGGVDIAFDEYIKKLKCDAY